MTYSLSFAVEHDYSAAEGIRVLVTLRHGQDTVSFDADVDTGSKVSPSEMKRIIIAL